MRLRGGVDDVLALERRLPELARPVPVLVPLERLEGLRPVLEAEVGEGVVGRTVVGDLAAGREHQQPVAHVEAEDAVGDDDDGTAVVGEAAQHVHHRAVHARVETGGRFVEEEQRRLGQQLQGHADALALPAGEAVHGLRGALFEAEFTDDLVDPGPAFGLGGVLGEAEFGRVRQGAVHGELGVQDVVLRDEADALAQFGVVAVKVAAVVEDGAAVGGALAGERVEQGGLSGAAGSDHGEQAFLADRERHLVEEDLAAPVDGDGEVLDVEGDLAGVDVLLQLVADETERGVSDADDVTRPDRGAGDGLAVEVGAVVAAEVDDLVRAVRPGPQFGVAAGDDQVVDDEVVVGGPADADGTAGQRPYGRRLPVGAGEGGHGDRRGAFRGRGGAVGEDDAGAVGRVAEADHAAGADAPLLDAAAVGVGAVRAVLVLQRPVVGVRPQDRVVPGDAGVVDDDVAERVAAYVVVAARGHDRGARFRLQEEFGRGRHHRPLWHAPNSTDSFTCAPGQRSGCAPVDTCQATGTTSAGTVRCILRASTDSASSSYSVVSSLMAICTSRPAANS